jgi:hypothetical protein
MKGKITLGRYQTNYDEPNPIYIQIEDDLSGVTFLKVQLSLENFAKMITGLGYIDCDFELGGLDKVGAKREHKEEIIPVPNNFSFREDTDLIDKYMKIYEVDGWLGRREDFDNNHNRVKGKSAFEVNFTRWIK